MAEHWRKPGRMATGGAGKESTDATAERSPEARARPRRRSRSGGHGGARRRPHAASGFQDMGKPGKRLPFKRLPGGGSPGARLPGSGLCSKRLPGGGDGRPRPAAASRAPLRPRVREPARARALLR